MPKKFEEVARIRNYRQDLFAFKRDGDATITTYTIYASYRILVGKPEGKRPLGRPRRR
jgi:hypothetical protein